jgi:hypothetical protein
MRGFHRLTDIILELYEGEKHNLGHIFDTLKVHLWGGAGKFIRLFGNLKQPDSEFGERAQKELKLNNKLVGEAVDALLKRLIAMRLDRIFGYHVSNTEDTLPCRVPSTPLFPNMRATTGEGPMWDKVTLDLLQGEHGPSIPEDYVRTCLDFLEEVDLYHFFYMKSAIETPDEDVLWQELQPGHTVQLKNGIYGQVILPRVEGPPGSVATHAAVISIMENAAHADERTGVHPEFPVPFLKRSRIEVVPLSHVKKRAHLNIYFGNLYREASAATQLFLVNIWPNDHFRGEPNRELYWRCPLTPCLGRVRVPTEGFGTFVCPLCRFSYPSL